MARVLHALGVLVALLGILVAVWPSFLGPCPRFVRQWRSGVFGAESVPLDDSDLRLYTAAELAQHDGSDESKPILLGMAGEVFDVTEKGKQFYGKQGAYNVFAGRDSTRCLALGSLDEEDLAKGGDVSDFTPEQRKQLEEQHKFYREKYPRVGRIAP